MSTTYADVAVALGRPISTPDEQAQVTWWLTGAQLIVRDRLGDPALLNQDNLHYVLVEAVAEKVRRHGQTESSITVAVDDGSVTRRYENPVTEGDITDAWWALLSPTTEARAFTINTIGKRWTCP